MIGNFNGYLRLLWSLTLDFYFLEFLYSQGYPNYPLWNAKVTYDANFSAPAGDRITFILLDLGVECDCSANCATTCSAGCDTGTACSTCPYAYVEVLLSS